FLWNFFNSYVIERSAQKHIAFGTPEDFTLICLLSATLFAFVLFRQRRRFKPARLQIATFALASCLAVAYSGWFVNLLIQNSIDTQGAVAEVKHKLAGAPLVSFQPLHHLFPFYYKEHIPCLDWPRAEKDVPADLAYFCFNADPKGAKPFSP